MDVIDLAAPLLSTQPVTPSIRWRKTIPGNAAHLLWVDAARDRLLVMDGWGVAFAALRLRALRIEDGQEVATARLGNAVRALTRDAEGNWLAATDTKLFRLEGDRLDTLEKWTARIPRYCDDLVMAGGFVHAANRAASTIYAIDPSSGAVKRRALDGEVRLHARDDAIVAMCSTGSIWSADYGLGKPPKRIAQLPASCSSAIDRSGHLWLSLGEGMIREPVARRGEPTNALARLDAPDAARMTVIVLPLPFWNFALSDDAETIAILGTTPQNDGAWHAQSDVALFRTADYRCERWLRMPEGFEVRLVDCNRRIGFALKPSVQPVEAELICFNL